MKLHKSEKCVSVYYQNISLYININLRDQNEKTAAEVSNDFQRTCVGDGAAKTALSCTLQCSRFKQELFCVKSIVSTDLASRFTVGGLLRENVLENMLAFAARMPHRSRQMFSILSQ